MTITVVEKNEKEGYFILSNNLTCRIYLSFDKIEDYISDVINQEKRTNSQYYFNVKTNEKVSEEEARKDGNIIWYPGVSGKDPGSSQYGCGYSYDFKRKITGLCTQGNSERAASYDRKNPEIKKKASCYINNISETEYDLRQREFNLHLKELAATMPSLWNLSMHWVEGKGNVTERVDDEGNPISEEEHKAYMKAWLGDDCFEKEKILLAKKREKDPELFAMIDSLVEENLKLIKEKQELDKVIDSFITE